MKLEQAARQALEAVHNSANALLFLARDCEMRNSAVDDCNEAIIALREALAGVNMSPTEPTNMNLNCKSVQARLATSWGYVKSEQAEHEPFDMDDHPPHRLCECRKCMEYFTPLPDCDAFAASGKPLAEQADEIDWIETNKALAKEIIELKKQAEQEPVAWLAQDDTFWLDRGSDTDVPLYAAPVRTKDLTSREIMDLWEASDGYSTGFARAVIAADREKNK